MDDEYEPLSLVLRERIESYEEPLCVVSARWSASDFPLNRPDFLATAFPRLERETVEDGARKSQVKTDVEPRFDADLCCAILLQSKAVNFSKRWSWARIARAIMVRTNSTPSFHWPAESSSCRA